MKNLCDITEDEAKEICCLANEPYLSVIAGRIKSWETFGLEVQIETRSTLKGDKDYGCIWIYKNGKIRLYKNNGGWNGSRDEEINALPITDYLRKQGYEFHY